MQPDPGYRAVLKLYQYLMDPCESVAEYTVVPLTWSPFPQMELPASYRTPLKLTIEIRNIFIFFNVTMSPIYLY